MPKPYLMKKQRVNKKGSTKLIECIDENILLSQSFTSFIVRQSSLSSSSSSSSLFA